MKTCKVEGCNREHHANGYCDRHCQQLSDRGEIFGIGGRSRKDKNEFITEGEVTKIITYDSKSFQTGYAIIDAEDAEKCRPYKWHFHKASGYIMCKKDGKTIKMHRFLLGLLDSDAEVDHINRIKHDNRKCNLRLSTSSGNKMNVGVKRNNASGYRGVHYKNGRDKWVAKIEANNECYHLGHFNTPEEAAIAYNEAAIKYHGGFACLNIIRKVS